jgi:hypothetical protein
VTEDQIREIGSWTLAIMSLAGSYHIGNKRRGAWLWMFFTQILWVGFGAVTNQSGFVLSGIGFGCMNLRNYLLWRKSDKHGSLAAAPAQPEKTPA